MKMTFSKDKFKQHCKANNFPMQFYGADWIDKTDGKEAIFIEGKEAGTCEGFVVLKEWCEPVEENTARGMFDALGFERKECENYIEYSRKTVIKNRFREESVVFFYEDKAFTTYDSHIEYCIYVDGELLKAINKQMQELGWM